MHGTRDTSIDIESKVRRIAFELRAMTRAARGRAGPTPIIRSCDPLSEESVATLDYLATACALQSAKRVGKIVAPSLGTSVRSCNRAPK